MLLFVPFSVTSSSNVVRLSEVVVMLPDWVMAPLVLRVKPPVAVTLPRASAFASTIDTAAPLAVTVPKSLPARVNAMSLPDAFTVVTPDTVRLPVVCVTLPVESSVNVPAVTLPRSVTVAFALFSVNVPVPTLAVTIPLIWLLLPDSVALALPVVVTFSAVVVMFAPDPVVMSPPACSVSPFTPEAVTLPTTSALV